MALTTSLTTLASKATPRNGFGGASAVWPALSSSRITPANPDASAKAPWTRTTVGPGMGFSSGSERRPKRRYVTGPERADPGAPPPARNSNRHGRPRGTVAAAARHAADAAGLGRRRRASAPLRTGPGRPGAGSATVRGGRGVTGRSARLRGGRTRYLWRRILGREDRSSPGALAAQREYRWSRPSREIRRSLPLAASRP